MYLQLQYLKSSLTFILHTDCLKSATEQNSNVIQPLNTAQIDECYAFGSVWLYSAPKKKDHTEE